MSEIASAGRVDTAVPLNSARFFISIRHRFYAVLRVFICCSVFSLSHVATAQPSDSYLIVTVAGNGSVGFSGDGGPATAATLAKPSGVVADTSGNIYITDNFNHTIRKVSPVGTITTIAGNGSLGFSGGPATAATLSSPCGLAVDTSNNVYIADTGNSRIRKVSPSGVISTIAGNGSRAFSGDGGPATAARLSAPWGIAINAIGNLYIAENENTRVRKLVPSQSTVGCLYTIDQSSQNFGPSGGKASVSVLAGGSTCPWLASSNADWLTSTPAGVGTGTGLIAYTVAPNPNNAPRTATIWIAGKSLTINQSGIVCSFDIKPRGVNVGASGVTGSSLSITSNAPDCQRSATANVPWILVSGGSSGTGRGNVTYTVGINTGGLRTGTVSVASRTVYVMSINWARENLCHLWPPLLMTAWLMGRATVL
jgi:Viral BACON domain/NHL repeat